MLSFKLTGGIISVANPDDKSRLIHTNVEVHEEIVHLSRFISSKLYCIEIPHDNTISALDGICANYTHIDDDTFKIVCSLEVD